MTPIHPGQVWRNPGGVHLCITAVDNDEAWVHPAAPDGTLTGPSIPMPTADFTAGAWTPAGHTMEVAA